MSRITRRTTMLLLLPMAVSGAQAAVQAGTLRQVGPPVAWVVRDSGIVNATYLHFGQVIENQSSRELLVDLVFRSYLPDGSPGPACASVWNGDSFTRESPVLPHGRTLVTCRAADDWTRGTSDLRLTFRLVDVQPIAADTLPLTVSNVRLQPPLDRSVPEQIAYGGEAVVAAPLHDTPAQVHFRFYDVSGVLLVTCSSPVVLLQPEIAQRTWCEGRWPIDAGRPQPASVTATVFSIGSAPH